MNSKVRRRIGAVATAAASVVALAACSTVQSGGGASSSSSTGTSDISIAAIYGNSGDPFWSSVGCGAQAEAKRLGVKVKIFSSTSTDSSAYDQSFNSAKLLNPDGFMVDPLNPNQFVAQYKQAMSSGLPVVTINGTSPTSQYRIIGTDVTETDYLDAIASLVPSGSGSIAIQDGVAGLVPVESRLQPVIKAVQKANPDLKTLTPQYSGFDQTKATQQTSSQILGHSDLKVIIAADGPDGAAAAAAVKAAGKAGKITVFALDATPPEVAALKDGTITALVAQAPLKIGALQLSTLVDYIKEHDGSKSPVEASDEAQNVPQKVLTKDNVDDPANSDWVYKASCSAS